MRINKTFILIFFLILTEICLGQPKSFIAVLELEAEGISESESRIITERLRTALFKTNQFTVLERDKMKEILTEQGFQQTGCTTNDCIVEMGRLIGVEEMVVGSIGKIGDLFTLNVRIIDIESGKVLNMAVDDCDCIIEDVLIKSTEHIAQQFANNTKQISVINKENNAENNQIQSSLKKRFLLSPVFGYGDNISTGWGLGLRSDFFYLEHFNLNLQYSYHYGHPEQYRHGKMWYLVSEFGYLFNLNDFTINPAFEGGIFNLHKNDYKRTGLCYGFNLGVDYSLTQLLSLGFDFKGLYGSDNIKVFLGGFSLDLTL